MARHSSKDLMLDLRRFEAMTFDCYGTRRLETGISTALSRLTALVRWSL
jgi:hypothetical protein